MDFSTLTDDQLVQLLKLAMAEAMQRGEAVRFAAEVEVLSAQQRLEIEQRVAAKYAEQQLQKEIDRIAQEAEQKFKQQELDEQAEKTKSLWSHKAAIVQAVREWGFEENFDVNIWSRGADRRVYFQQKGRGRKSQWSWCYYVTGNRYNGPGTLEGEGADCFFDDKQDGLERLLKAIAEAWQGDLAFNSGAVGGAEPNEKWLKYYRKAIGLAPNGQATQEAATNV